MEVSFHFTYMDSEDGEECSILLTDEMIQDLYAPIYVQEDVPKDFSSLTPPELINSKREIHIRMTRPFPTLSIHVDHFEDLGIVTQSLIIYEIEKVIKSRDNMFNIFRYNIYQYKINNCPDFLNPQDELDTFIDYLTKLYKNVSEKIQKYVNMGSLNERKAYQSHQEWQDKLINDFFFSHPFLEEFTNEEYHDLAVKCKLKKKTIRSMLRRRKDKILQFINGSKKPNFIPPEMTDDDIRRFVMSSKTSSPILPPKY